MKEGRLWFGGNTLALQTGHSKHIIDQRMEKVVCDLVPVTFKFGHCSELGGSHFQR